MFESLTLDEVLLVIKGHVDRQRIERRNAYVMYCLLAKDPVSIFDFLPLPYDDELTERPIASESDKDFYQQAIESGYLNSQWWNN